MIPLLHLEFGLRTANGHSRGATWIGTNPDCDPRHVARLGLSHPPLIERQTSNWSLVRFRCINNPYKKLQKHTYTALPIRC